MTLEDQITALCAEAEPLRCLPDEEAEARGLPALVDRINALRAKQAQFNPFALINGAVAEEWGRDPRRQESDAAAVAAFEAQEALPKRKPGRPRKAEA